MIMTTKPTQEQWKELLELCGVGCVHSWKYFEHKTPLWGLDCIKCKQKYGGGQWSRGHAPEIGDIDNTPELNLTNLFKYVITKLRSLEYPIISEVCFDKENSQDLAMILWWTGKPKTDSYGCGVFAGRGETEAEALFWACWEAIHHKKGDKEDGN